MLVVLKKYDVRSIDKFFIVQKTTWLLHTRQKKTNFSNRQHVTSLAYLKYLIHGVNYTRVPANIKFKFDFCKRKGFLG